jgi:hypothetical protein
VVSQESKQMGMLRDLSNEDDWGLDGLEERLRPRTSLIQEIMGEEQMQEGGLNVSSTGQVGIKCIWCRDSDLPEGEGAVAG